MIIGKIIETNENISIDLNKLVRTRGLIQANSGGGKSWIIRRLLEQSHGKVQQIVIDLDGEFSTLREKFDYLLVGKDGEIPADIKTAELLAKRLLEINVSTIIDLSELKHYERILFVKRFLDSLINSPKKLWHPVLVLVDEAHQFCPQSSKSESASSVIDLMTRGRKRGFCGILATQRISKLHKDASAEANNRMIGRTGQDVDRKRASEELGFTSKDDERSLRNLTPGEFYMFGPAISTDVIKVKVGDVQTTHPDISIDKKIIVPSKTPENIKKVLKDVMDLSKEAEEEFKEIQDYKKKISELKRELSISKRQQSTPQVDERAIQKANEKGFNEAKNQMMKEINFLRRENNIIIKRDEKIANLVSGLLNTPLVPRPEYKAPEFVKENPIIMPKEHKQEFEELISEENEVKLNLCARRIYSFLFENPGREFTKTQLSVMTGYSMKSSGFNNAISQLNVAGLIKRNNNHILLGKEMPEFANEAVGEYRTDLILAKLGKCPRMIFKIILDNPLREYSKEELAESTGYSTTSSGFNNALSKLNSMKLIQRVGSMIKLNEEIEKL